MATEERVVYGFEVLRGDAGEDRSENQRRG